MRLILVRHGQTPSNVAGLLDTGAPGPGLTSLGHRQAAAVPGALAEEQVEVVYASTLVRTQQTAAPLVGRRGLEVRVREELREVRAGDLEMRGDERAVRTYLETIFGWAEDLDRRMPGGESGAEVLQRYDAVVEEVAAAGFGSAVIFSHGAAIRAWTALRADNVAVEFAATHAVSNTGAVVLEGSPAAGWQALSWEGRALGGVRVDEPALGGPAGEPRSTDVLDGVGE